MGNKTRDGKIEIIIHQTGNQGKQNEATKHQFAYKHKTRNVSKTKGVHLEEE